MSQYIAVNSYEQVNGCGDYETVEGCGEYETVGYIDPFSSAFMPNAGLIAGGMYGYLSQKDKSTVKKALHAGIWGVAGKFLPVPVIAWAVYKYVKGEVKF